MSKFRLKYSEIEVIARNVANNNTWLARQYTEDQMLVALFSDLEDKEIAEIKDEDLMEKASEIRSNIENIDMLKEAIHYYSSSGYFYKSLVKAVNTAAEEKEQDDDE